VITGAAFCPHPPVLVPEVASGAAAELRDLRAACGAALTAMSRDVDEIVVLGSGDRTVAFDPAIRGSFAGFGVDLQVALAAGADGPVELPLSLTVGAWLVRDAIGDGVAVRAISVAAGTALDELAIADLVDVDARRIGLLVMGDGSARRSTAAPGYLDERAVPFDDTVAAALKDGDAAALASIDAQLAADLLVAGAPAWHAAGALLRRATIDAELLYYDAPFGVGYLVASWVVRA
jgi:hypothetical protein